MRRHAHNQVREHVFSGCRLIRIVMIRMSICNTTKCLKVKKTYFLIFRCIFLSILETVCHWLQKITDETSILNPASHGNIYSISLLHKNYITTIFCTYIQYLYSTKSISTIFCIYIHVASYHLVFVLP